MQVKSAAVLLAGLATTATPFVIVPEVTEADDNLFSILPIEVASETQAQTVQLECPGCPVRLSDDVVATNAENHLELRFEVAHDTGVDRLVVNGFELYPKADPFAASLKAKQVVDAAVRRGRMGDAGADVPLGYKLLSRPVAQEEDGQMLELVEIELQVIEVGNTFVQGVPIVTVKLVRNGENLAITSVEKGDPKCETVWCRVEAFLGESLGRFKGPCPGMRHGGHAPPAGHMKIPGHGHPHHHHHGEFRQGSPQRPGFFATLVYLVAHILLPIVIGVVAGIGFSLIGMAISSFLFVLIRRLRGTRSEDSQSPGTAHKVAAKEVVVVPEEKEGLMENQEEHQEPPPSYEEPAPRS